MWSPPTSPHSAGLSLLELYRTGFLNLMLPWNNGISAFLRVDKFEKGISSLLTSTLPPRGIKRENSAFVQMIASNPIYSGKGYASKLLEWQMKQHFEEFPDKPVLLDTTTKQAIRAYERLGWEMLAEKELETGTDKDGFWLRRGASQEEKREAREVCLQRVMILMPPGKR
jgi:GNAT superfamily N-acetyltransferase